MSTCDLETTPGKTNNDNSRGLAASRHADTERSFVAELVEVAAREGWTAAAGLIGANWDRLATQAPDELLAAVKALPIQAFIDNPGFAMAANHLQRLVIEADPGRFVYDARIDPVAQAGHAATSVMQLTSLIGSIVSARTAATPEKALPLIAESRSHVAAASATEMAQLVSSLPHMRLQWARTLEAADEPGAAADYEQVFEDSQLTDQPYLARRAAAHLAWHHADHGRLRLADEWADRARQQAESNPRHDAPLHLAAALVALDRGDLRQADVELALLSKGPRGESWAAALWIHAIRAQTSTDAVQVEVDLATELGRHPGASAGTSNSRYLRATQVRLALLRGRTLPPNSVNAGLTPHEYFVAAVAALHAKQHQKAADFSELAAERHASPRIFAGAFLVHAAAQIGLRRHRAAETALHQALRIIDTEQLFSAYRLMPVKDLHLLADRSEPDIARRIRTAAFGALPVEVMALTPRQREILDLLGTDRGLQEIADQLYISINTLKSALRTIYKTLHVNSRAAATAIANRAHLP